MDDEVNITAKVKNLCGERNIEIKTHTHQIYIHLDERKYASYKNCLVVSLVSPVENYLLFVSRYTGYVLSFT